MASSQDWWRFAAREVWAPTADEMAEIDSHAIATSIPERSLIENAGRSLAVRLHDRWPEGPVVALVGGGHNGADGLVAARTLHAWGRPVRLVRCGAHPPDPDVLLGWELALDGPESLGAALAGCAVVIDGILGTGVRSAPRAAQAEIIERLNAAGVPVVAVDGPSGVDFTTGAVPGAAVRADLTVTFGWPKLGLLRHPARSLCGDIEVVEIGLPSPVPAPRARVITAAWIADLLGHRPANAHKGDAGYLTLVAGQPGMAGAAILAARAAIRAGVGIVRVVSAPANREIVQTALPAAVFVSWDDAGAVGEAIAWADAVALGPGLGSSAERRSLVEAALGGAAGRPVILDADALNVFSGQPKALANRVTGPAVLTPHPGEMARLVDRSAPEIGADPPAAARSLAAQTGATVVLKGSPSWVADPAGDVRVSSLASAAFATGGMGDVLTGLVGAYLATGLGPADAASAALMVSGLATVTGGPPVGRSADDIPDRLPAARASLDLVRPGATAGVLFALPAVEDDAP